MNAGHLADVGTCHQPTFASTLVRDQQFQGAGPSATAATPPSLRATPTITLVVSVVGRIRAHVLTESDAAILIQRVGQHPPRHQRSQARATDVVASERKVEGLRASAE